MHFVLLLEQLFDALTPSFKYALRLNQWKGARVLRQTNTRGCGYNSFFIIQSGQVSEGVAISVSWHVNSDTNCNLIISIHVVLVVERYFIIV